MSVLQSSQGEQEAQEPDVKVNPELPQHQRAGRPRAIFLEIFLDEEDIEHPVKTQPRMAFLHWDNRDTLQFYAGGYEYSIYLGPYSSLYVVNDIPDDTIQLPRGEYSEILRLREGNKPGGRGSRRLPDFQIWLGHGPRPERAVVHSTSHSDVIFDP